MGKIYNFIEGLLEVVILVMATTLMGTGMFDANVSIIGQVKHILFVCLLVCLPLILVRDGLLLFKEKEERL